MKRIDDLAGCLSKSFFAVLLAMLIAITQTASVEAAPQSDSKIPYIEYMMVLVEGAQNLKSAKQNERLNVPDGNAKRDIREEHYFGEFAAGKTIKVHAINKKVENAGNAPTYQFKTKMPKDTNPMNFAEYKRKIEEEKKSKEYQDYLKRNKMNIRYAGSSSVIKLTAKAGDKIVKQLEKNEDDVVDLYLEYKIPDNVTQISIWAETRKVVETGEHFYYPTRDVYVNLTPTNGTGGTASTDKKSQSKKTNTAQPQESDEDSTDWGTIFVVGGGIAAVGGIGFGVSRLLGGGGADSSDTNPQYPQEPESFVYTDPATGAQTLYERDPNTGEWFDPTTGAITDISKIGDYTRQRAADRRWMDGQMKNLSDRNTAVDKAWQEQDAAADERMQKTFEEIDRHGAKDKAAIRSGTYGMTDAQRTEYLNQRQTQFETNQDAAHRTANNWDRATKVAEGVQKAADIGMDIAATAAKAVDGGVVSGRIKDAYSMAKNVAGSTSDAVAKGKSVWLGIGKGFADGIVDIAQNNSEGVYKALSYVGGDGFKGGLDAAWKGESVTKGVFKGTVQGTMKLGIDKVGEKISKGIEKSSQDSLKNAYDHAREIRTVYSNSISQKSVNALQKMNLDRHLANTAKAAHQSMANNISSALASNLLPDAVTDAVF